MIGNPWGEIGAITVPDAENVGAAINRAIGAQRGAGVEVTGVRMEGSFLHVQLKVPADLAALILDAQELARVVGWTSSGDIVEGIGKR